VKNGVEPTGGSPDELAHYINSDLVKWAKVIKSAGVHID